MHHSQGNGYATLGFVLLLLLLHINSLSVTYYDALSNELAFPGWQLDGNCLSMYVPVLFLDEVTPSCQLFIHHLVTGTGCSGG